MQADLGVALQLMAVGMSITFGIIVLLWGLMALLTRLTAERVAVDAIPAVAPLMVEPSQAEPSHEQRRRAVAAAVAVAMARHRMARHGAAKPATTVSPWQAASRVSRSNWQGRDEE